MKTTPLQEETVACNLCGADDYTIIYKKIDTPLEVPLHEKFSAAKGILSTDQIVKCRHCGLVYTNPRIKQEIMLDSCSQGDDEVYVSQEEGRKKTFQEGLHWIKSKTHPTRKEKILDVGCAAGFFLSVAQEQGFEPYGVELNAWLAEKGRTKFNLKNIMTGTLEEARWKNDFFDYVTVWDVLEHVPNPLQTLQEINRITQKNGYIIISYPDYSSIFAKIFGRRWWFLLSHHIYYFTPKTMKSMLEKAGYRIIDDKMHWQKLKVVYMLDMFVKLNKNKIVQFPFKLTSSFLKALKLENLSIRYYASQRDVIAQKK
ncbi:MAG: class I SAM-dependent methyltransferase [Patescibacteria group bacterium]